MPPAMTVLPAARSANAAAPLPAVLVQSVLNSLGTGAVTNGVFFVTDAAYSFSPLANYLLALLAGLSYIAGAVAVAPALERLIARSAAMTPRRALVLLLIALGLCCLLPWLAPSPATIWLFIALYAPLTGALWPIVESYVSGGRTGRALRAATGAFNFSWAAAVALAYWLMAPALALGAPLLIIALLGAVHILAAALAGLLPPAPGRHVEAPHPHPPVYEPLLAVFRQLLVLSYVLLYAISPLLPTKLTDLGVALAWQTPLASLWMVSRLGVFALLERWEGWHGRWRTPLWTGGAMLAGFALFVLAPDVLTLSLALGLFGLGAGGVYAAALYYALEVGRGAVEAGGGHEARIGAGYTLGPAAGALAWLAVRAEAVSAATAPRLMLLFIVAIAVVFALLALRAAGLRP